MSLNKVDMNRSERMQLRLTPYHLAALTQLAKEECRSRSNYIESIIDRIWEEQHAKDHPFDFEAWRADRPRKTG